MSNIEEELRESFIEKKDLEIDKMFRACVKLQGSDLHLKVGRPPVVRVKGELRGLNRDPINDEEMLRIIASILNTHRKKQLDDNGGSDFSHTVNVDGEIWRFRVNVLKAMGHLGLVARRVSNFIPNFKGLNLPPVMGSLCHFDQGMILLSGPTGSGKTTTIASMLDFINQTYRKHILTLEDPIEFVYKEDKCLINQREVGQDVRGFDHGMRQAMREDPDIMLLGEMRDRETFETALQAAETGHLVFGTVHASSAATTIGRILNLFPEEMHNAVRTNMAFNMRAIMAQKLLRGCKPSAPRVPAIEVMVFTPTVRKLVLEGQETKLPDAIRIGKDDGMQDFTMSLKQLVDDELIDRPTAFEAAPNLEALKMALKGIDVSQGGLL